MHSRSFPPNKPPSENHFRIGNGKLHPHVSVTGIFGRGFCFSWVMDFMASLRKAANSRSVTLAVGLPAENVVGFSICAAIWNNPGMTESEFTKSSW
jgi:hypothetical protein